LVESQRKTYGGGGLYTPMVQCVNVDVDLLSINTVVVGGPIIFHHLSHTHNILIHSMYAP